MTNVGIVDMATTILTAADTWAERHAAEWAWVRDFPLSGKEAPCKNVANQNDLAPFFEVCALATTSLYTLCKGSLDGPDPRDVATALLAGGRLACSL